MKDVPKITAHYQCRNCCGKGYTTACALTQEQARRHIRLTPDKPMPCIRDECRECGGTGVVDKP